MAHYSKVVKIGYKNYLVSLIEIRDLVELVFCILNKKSWTWQKQQQY